MQEGNLIINYLPHHFYEDDLRRLFSTVATPTYVKIMKNNMGVSKGFGFVNFATREEAEMCLKIFNKFRITERKQLKVSWSRPGYRVGCNLHVKHIPRSWNENDVLQLFKPFGEIIDVRVLRFPNSTFNKEAGFVRFNDPQAAREAVQALNGYRPPEFPECCILIEIAHKDMKKIESRYNRRHYRKSHYKAQSNNMITLLMNLLGERKAIEQRLGDELMRLEQNGHGQRTSKEYVRLNVGWEQINQEMHSQLRALYHSDPVSAEVVARVDETAASWMFQFMSEREMGHPAESEPQEAYERMPYNPRGQRQHHHRHHRMGSALTREEWPTISGAYDRAGTESVGSSNSNAGFTSETRGQVSDSASLENQPKTVPSIGRCVFFSNFPPQFPEQVITSTFETFSKVIKLKVDYDNNGRSLGMGCCMFETVAQAHKVCQCLNHAEFLDRKISLLMMPEGCAAWD